MIVGVFWRLSAYHLPLKRRTYGVPGHVFVVLGNYEDGLPVSTFF